MQREPGEKYKWSWIKEIKKPKLVSFLATPVIKGQPESEIVQAVVRISGEEVIALFHLFTNGVDISLWSKFCRKGRRFRRARNQWLRNRTRIPT